MTSLRFDARRATAVAAAAGAALALAGVAGAVPAAQTGAAATPPKQETHAQLVTKSKRESGLVVYGNPPSAQFKILTDLFTKRYPWIKVTAYDLDNQVVFSRYLGESSQGQRTADVLISSAPNLWVYANRRKLVNQAFQPTDLTTANYPPFAKQFPGIFIMSPDPAVIAFNKLLLSGDKIPRSVSDLAAKVRSDPGTYRNKLTGYVITNGFGQAADWAYVAKRGWSALDTIIPQTRALGGSNAQLQLLAQGGAVVAWLTSGIVRGQIDNDQAFSRILGWTYSKDTTPIVPRGIAVTAKASSPASAKLFLNYIYSAAGQQSLCDAGFTASRLNWRAQGKCAKYTYAALANAVGRSNLSVAPYTLKYVNSIPQLQARWRQAAGG